MKSKPTLVKVEKRSDNKDLKILKFYAKWCAPCKALTLFLDNKGYTPRVDEEIDIDDNQELASQYNIRGIPTLVAVDNEGMVIDMITGFSNDSVERIEGFFDNV